MPMRSVEDFDEGWNTTCKKVYANLDSKISETVDDSLREDLKGHVLTEAGFMMAVGGTQRLMMMLSRKWTHTFWLQEYSSCIR